MTQRIGNSGSGEGQEDQVIDFNQMREKRLQEKKRNAERIFFKNLLSVYSVFETTKLIPIEVIDVSEEGCSFQIPHNPEKIWPKQLNNLPIRFYFSADSYLEIFVNIQNSSPTIDGNHRYVRFGCSVDKTVQSYSAYQLFVRFLKTYAEYSYKDVGDRSIFYI